MRRGRALRPDYQLRQAEICFNLADTAGDRKIASRYALMGSHFLRRLLRDEEALFSVGADPYRPARGCRPIREGQ